MKRLLLIFALFIVGADECEPTVPPPPPPDRSPYCYGEPTLGDQIVGQLNAIFGGEESTDRRATLRMAFPNSRCTGVALDAKTALTAAHCAYGQERITAALSGYSEPPYWDATHWEIHPDYLTYLYSGNRDREKAKADIAVVQFDKARTGEDGLPPPYVDGFFDPLDPADASQCLRFVAQGWGKWEGSELSLRECEYEIDVVEDRQVVTNHGPDDCRICFGDSGGPLYAQMRDGSLKLVGLARTTADTECRISSTHARVSTQADWIEAQ